jgi:hypothetical protein
VTTKYKFNGCEYLTRRNELSALKFSFEHTFSGDPRPDSFVP